jgi:hypothetical protein
MQKTNTVCCGVRDRVCRDGMATELVKRSHHNSDALSRTHVLTPLAFLLSLRALLYAIQVTCIRVAVLPPWFARL